jgi:hypothetical protein
MATLLINDESYEVQRLEFAGGSLMFSVQGPAAENLYTVRLAPKPENDSCTCPGHRFHKAACKHICALRESEMSNTNATTATKEEKTTVLPPEVPANRLPARVVQQVPPDPLSMIQMAIERGVNPDQLTKLFDLQERYEKNRAKEAFALAMNRAQAEMPVVVKDATNSATNSKYARLEKINSQIKPIYTKHGFSLSFGTEDCPYEHRIRIFADVWHIGGHCQRYQGDYPLDMTGPKGNVNKTELHAMGSTCSYGRRYLTLQIFNISVANEDNDGNKPDPRKGSTVTPPPAQPQPAPATPDLPKPATPSPVAPAATAPPPSGPGMLGPEQLKWTGEQFKGRADACRAILAAFGVARLSELSWAWWPIWEICVSKRVKPDWFLADVCRGKKIVEQSDPELEATFVELKKRLRL